MKLSILFRRFFYTSLMAVSVTGALAGELPFEQKKFDAAVAAGESVVVDFSASWCPTCKAQKTVVDKLMALPKYRAVTLFVADYDKEVALKKQLRVVQQSTFVVFKGSKEVTRSTGQTDADVLASVFDKAL
ncbi:MAG: thioredoxin family protein [Polaromonas sp.]